MRLHDLRCEHCGGEGCGRCDGTGDAHLEECPRVLLGRDGGRILLAADLARHGSWPEPGGWLDQLECVLQGVQAAWAEEAPYRARARLGLEA